MFKLSSTLGLIALVSLLGTTYAFSDLTFWEGDVKQNIAMMKTGTYSPYREVNNFVNSIFFHFANIQPFAEYLEVNFGPDNGYYLQCYVRDWIAGTLVYWIAAGLWHVAIYWILGDQLFTSQGRRMPSTATIVDQMCLAQASLFLYAALPVLSEILIENNLTRSYFFIDEVGGWGMYAVYFILYLTFVEVGVYWVHRTLHTNKFLYKYVHGLHHKYNKAITLTPWCSIAFNPIDGILQASPYVVGLFFIPMHYFTHIIMLFFTGLWATNIHDAVWSDGGPIMGSKYHTVHHTHYHYNFGQFFVFADYVFGTLRVPEKSKFE